MRTKTTVKEVISYICEVCEKEYPAKSYVDFCETEHKKETCDHANVWYSIDSEDDYGSIDFFIKSHCQACMQDLKSWRLNYLDSEVLGRFTKIIDGQPS